MGVSPAGEASERRDGLHLDQQLLLHEAVDHAFDGIDLITDRTLWLATGIRPVGPIGRSVRIGITKAVDRELRFFERGSPFVSGPKWLNRSGALTAPRRSAPR